MSEVIFGHVRSNSVKVWDEDIHRSTPVRVGISALNQARIYNTSYREHIAGPLAAARLLGSGPFHLEIMNSAAIPVIPAQMVVDAHAEFLTMLNEEN